VTSDLRRFVGVVDDDPAVVDAVQFLLELAGHPVVGYPSATAFLDATPPLPACLILDQHMPEMTGLVLAARLRETGHAIPMLLMTGSPSPAITARAAELGIERVLDKPPDEADLLGFIAAHLPLARGLREGALGLFISGERHEFSEAGVARVPEEHGVYALYDGDTLIFYGRSEGRSSSTLRGMLLDHMLGTMGRRTRAVTTFRYEVADLPAIRQMELLEEYKRLNGRVPRCNERLS